ncbi:MAG: IS66 family transposase [Bacteroidales bacterium]|nr:IS66 family transposase [Bacteroidales bacterium]
MTKRTQIPPKESIESLDRESMVGLVVSMFEKICSLEKRLEYYERREYGRRSERHTDYDPNQLLLFEDCSFTEEEKEVVDSLMQETPAKEKSAKNRKKAKPHGRKPLSVTGLPTETVDVYPEGVLDSDGNLLPEYEEIGTEVSESLEMTPAKFYRRRLVRHKVVKKEGEGSKADPEHTRVMTPALLPDEKERLKAGNSVLADLLIKKFREYLTYYRAVDIYKELGVDVRGSTVIGWYQAAVERIRPLYELIMRKIMSSPYIQSDESTIAVINHEKKQACKEYIWAARSIQSGMVGFRYIGEGGRDDETARQFLDGAHPRVLQTDGYAGYVQFEGETTHAACWAHTRRNYDRSLTTDSKRGNTGLAFIKRIYEIDDEATAMGLDADGRRQLRQQKSAVVVSAFFKWAKKNRHDVLPKSSIGEALSYMIAREEQLKVFLEDGNVPLDTNDLERSIRPFTISRKNFLFADNHLTAQDVAVAMTVVQSGKESGVNLRVWLTDIIEKIPAYVKDKKPLDDLLPNEWANLPESKRLLEEYDKRQKGRINFLDETTDEKASSEENKLDQTLPNSDELDKASQNLDELCQTSSNSNKKAKDKRKNKPITRPAQ